MTRRPHKSRINRDNSESGAPAAQTRPLEGEIGRPAAGPRDVTRSAPSAIHSLDASKSKSKSRRATRLRPKPAGPRPKVAATAVNTGNLDRIRAARAARKGHPHRRRLCDEHKSGARYLPQARGRKAAGRTPSPI